MSEHIDDANKMMTSSAHCKGAFDAWAKRTRNEPGFYMIEGTELVSRREQPRKRAANQAPEFADAQTFKHPDGMKKPPTLLLGA